MFKEDAIKHFSVALAGRRRRDKDMAVTNIANALGRTTTPVSKWREIIPEVAAEKLYRLTYKAIPLHPEHYTAQKKLDEIEHKKLFRRRYER